MGFDVPFWREFEQAAGHFFKVVESFPNPAGLIGAKHNLRCAADALRRVAGACPPLIGKVQIAATNTRGEDLLRELSAIASGMEALAAVVQALAAPERASGPSRWIRVQLLDAAGIGHGNVAEVARGLRSAAQVLGRLAATWPTVSATLDIVAGQIADAQNAIDSFAYGVSDVSNALPG